MLYWMDKEKEITEIGNIHKSLYDMGEARLSAEDMREIEDYINTLIDESISKGNDTYVPGWKAPGSWAGTPLQKIYDIAFPGDEKSCALWYGLVSMQMIIERNEQWLATKTNFNRDFDQTVYWRQAE